MKDFNTFGVMIDCSRNAVMNVDEVKNFATIISEMGYNTLMLYTEDTYKVENEPFFGLMRGSYTQAELQEIDKHCKSVGIELIPCIQTLAHLNCMFKWWSEYNEICDIDDVLLIDDERTYALIENMFSQISRTFSSKKVHIGMDEAYSVGLGKHLEKFGYEQRYNLIVRHLDKVCKTAAKYGLEPMIWSDMFVKLGMSTSDYYSLNESEIKKPDADIPENVSLVYWDYYSTDYNRYKKLIGVNQTFGRKVLFAGGIWTWRGFAPDNAYTLKTSYPAINACRDCGIKDVIMTMWGDDGAECSKYSVLPSLFYVSEIAKGNEDIDSIKEKFLEKFEFSFDSMFLLDKLDTPSGKSNDNPSKYMLYNDPFTGLKDSYCNSADREYYRVLKEQISSADCSSEYKYVFDTCEKLCAVLELKCDLGLRTRSLYKKGDTEGLKRLANVDYNKTAELLRDFYSAFKRQWFKENKPHGFDIQDIRIGGLLMRLTSCRDRLLEYANGDITSIPELEEPVLNGDCGKTWARSATPNVISHII